MKTNYPTQRTRRTDSNSLRNTFGDFVCLACHNFVSAEATLSGVHNRNHCPYCLSSRHLDLYKAGDRLSACKSCMRPIALTIKKTGKKYNQPNQGEMMLIHMCDECGKLSINRIAADDDVETVIEIFESSRKLDAEIKSLIIQAGITIIEAEDGRLVRERLLGRNWN
jgi:hypothetical protein